MGFMDLLKKGADFYNETKEQKAEIERQNKQQLEQIKQGINMPVFEPIQGLLLTKNEVMHFACVCKYLFIKEEKGLGYGGVKVKVSKNITLNTGVAQSAGRKVQKQIKGNLIITNKRTMFMPLLNDESFNVQLNKLETYQIYKDGITLRTDKNSYPIEFEKKDIHNLQYVETVLLGALKNIE